jgi:hypothetical protein
MNIDSRYRMILCSMDTIVEIACSEAAAFVIDDIAKVHKMNPLHVAMYVPGVAHDHPPCDDLVASCAYCKRNGNVFSPDDTISECDDLISRYKRRVAMIFEEMSDEIRKTVEKVFETKNDEDDDLERMLMESLSLDDE